MGLSRYLSKLGALIGSDGKLITSGLADGAVTAAKLASTAVTDKLGYTPLNKAGDGMTGPLGVGVFTLGSNSGEARLGRANDRSVGVATLQLGGTAPQRFEVVDKGWSTVLFAVNNDGTVNTSGALSSSGTISASGVITSSAGLKAPTEEFSYGTGSVRADGNWQTIISGLNGHHSFMFSADTGESGWHDTGVHIVSGCYGAGNAYRFNGGGESWANSVITFRISGSTYSWNVDVKSAVNHATAMIYFKYKRFQA